MALPDFVKKLFGTVTDTPRSREIIKGLLPLLRMMDTPKGVVSDLGVAPGAPAAPTEARPGIHIDVDLTDPRDEMVKALVELVRRYPEYTIMRLAKGCMIVRTEDVEKFASKGATKFARERGLLSTRDDLPSA